MNNQLQRQLISQGLPHYSTQTQSARNSSSQIRQQNAYNPQFVRIKLYLFIIMVSIFLLYRFFSSNLLQQCISDLAHQWTFTLNKLIIENQIFYEVVIIIAQQSIQINIICLCILTTWKVKNLQGHFFLTLFFLIRAVFLNIEKFPYPSNYRWDAPIIPSLTVPYGVTRDYFYSGHTGVMLFSTFWWKLFEYKWMFYCNLVLTPFVIIVLLSTRVHYSIDVVAAIIFTLWINNHILKHVIYFDKLWSYIIRLMQKVCSRILTFFH